MTDREWRERLKAGDEVLIPVQYSRGDFASHKVDRVTATQIVVGSRRFRKSNGYLITSDKWSTTGIVPPNDARRELMQLAALRRKAIVLREKLAVPTTKEELEKFIAALEPLVGEGK